LSCDIARPVSRSVYPPPAGIDDAGLAQVAGHTVETMLGTYTQALERSHQRIRQVVG
jgi:hypothetical protein